MNTLNAKIRQLLTEPGKTATRWFVELNSFGVSVRRFFSEARTKPSQKTHEGSQSPRSRYPIVGLFVLLGIASCTARPIEYEAATITLSRDGNCFECPWYAVTIHDDGTVIFRGVSNVNSRRERLGHIPQDSVHAIVEEMMRIRYFAMKNSYDDRKFSDAETVTTSLKLGQHEKKIVDHFGAPDSLHSLEQHIDRIAEISRWVGEVNHSIPTNTQRLLVLRHDIDSMEAIDDAMLQRYQALRETGEIRAAYHLFFEERKLNNRIDKAYEGFQLSPVDSVSTPETDLQNSTPPVPTLRDSTK